MQDKKALNNPGVQPPTATADWRRNIVLFLSSQTISLFGSMLVQYAITWYINLETKSGVMVTISILCGFLPTFLISPFAGVWADRYSRRRLIVVADLMIAASTFGLAILFLMGHNALWLLFVISAIRALGSGIQTPAVSAVLPQLVPADKLMKVNAANSSIQSLMALVSPMLAGALLAVANIEAIFFIDVCTAVVAVAVLLAFVRLPVHAKALTKQTAGYFSDMLVGLKYIRHHEFLRTFFLFVAVFFFLATPVAFLSALQVTRNFGEDVWRLAAVEVAFSIGMLAGSAAIAAWGGFKNKTHSLVLAGLGTGIFVFALGITQLFWLYLVFMAIVGVVWAFFNTPSMVLLQQEVGEDFLGRVFGVMGMITSTMLPLGMLVFGPLADIIDIGWLFIGTGAFTLVLGVCLWNNKTMIKAGRSSLNSKVAVGTTDDRPVT